MPGTVRRNILITGASSGLGAEMARQFAAKGRNLALCARRTERLDALAAELTTGHPECTVSVRALDVDDHDAVFTVFRGFAEQLGGLDRVIVNAGIGDGGPVGTGRFDGNRRTAQTNFVAALAQCEAAMEHFRARGAGHLVVVSSVAAVRGLPRDATVYAATKAAVSALAEGIRVETVRTPITVSTILPGYISTEINAGQRAPMMVSAATGVRSMVRAIEREPATAYVPALPWRLLGPALKIMPRRLLNRMA